MPLSFPVTAGPLHAFTVGGALLTAASFVLLMLMPVNFSYALFALILVLNGFGSGLFASPNRAEIMNSVPANQRGAAGGNHRYVPECRRAGVAGEGSWEPSELVLPAADEADSTRAAAGGGAADSSAGP